MPCWIAPCDAGKGRGVWNSETTGKCCSWRAAGFALTAPDRTVGNTRLGKIRLASTAVTRLKKGGFVIHIYIHVAKITFARKKMSPVGPLPSRSMASACPFRTNRGARRLAPHAVFGDVDEAEKRATGTASGRRQPVCYFPRRALTAAASSARRPWVSCQSMQASVMLWP